MAKYKNKHYMQLSRKIFTDEYSYLSNGAKWLFVVLNELEQRYTSGKDESKEDWFFRSDQELAKDANIGITSLKKYKRELIKSDLIEFFYMRNVNEKTGKHSEYRLSAYRILK